MKLSLVVTILVIGLLLLFSEENEAGKRRPSRKRSPSKVRKPTSRKGKKPSRPKAKATPTIYKNTHMPIKTYSSPVIIQQTKYKSKSSRYPAYIAAGAAGAITYYALTRAPVYRGYYPMYGNHLRIPSNRGVRVLEERQEIVNRYTNERCYTVITKKVEENTPNPDENIKSNNPNRMDMESLDANTTTTITFDGDLGKTEFDGEKNISMDENDIDKMFTATTITDYAKDIPGTKISGNCTRVVTTTRASMIKVYDSNPYANAAFVEPSSSFALIFTLLFLSFKLIQ